MNSLRISVVYPSGYAPIIASCGVLAMYPMIDNEHPIKIGLKVAGTHTSNCKTQELLLTHYVFDELEKAQEFNVIRCFRLYRTVMPNRIETLSQPW